MNDDGDDGGNLSADDQWYAGLLLGAGVTMLAFVTLLIATRFLSVD